MESVRKYYKFHKDITHRTDISMSAKVLYPVLFELCSNEKEYSWATNKYLAKQIGIKERQVKNIVRELRDKELIAVFQPTKRTREIRIIEWEESLGNDLIILNKPWDILK